MAVSHTTLPELGHLDEKLGTDLEDVSPPSYLSSIGAKNDNLLVVSPYDEVEHLLDLRTVDTANQLLAKALVGLKCLRDDYATAPYVEIFNVSEYLQFPKDSSRYSLIFETFCFVSRHDYNLLSSSAITDTF